MKKTITIITKITLLTYFIVLSGCGGSNNLPDQKSDNPTEIKTPLAEVSPAPPDSGSAPSTKASNETGAYNRPYDFPRIKVLPLQYIDTTSGHRVGLRVTLPADKKGTPVEGPLPVVLSQSAYNVGMLASTPVSGAVLLGGPDPFIVRHGYAMVSVDVIGSGVSEGGWELLGAEEQSGYGDVVDWIKQQPWYDGNLGVAGASYMAITSLFTAQQRPEDIKAIFASVPMGDSQRGTVGTGGLLNGVFLSAWATLTHLTSTLNDLTALQYPELKEIIDGATQRHVEQIDQYYLPMVNKILEGDPEITYDNDFWRIRSPITHIDKIQAPTFILGAVNDIFQRDAPLLYERLKDRVDSRLVIFNGDHASNFVQAIRGTDKTDPILNLMLQWFDRYLKDMETGLDNIPPVTQYVKNYKKGMWKGYSDATDWPHPSALPERWFLHGNGNLTTSPPTEPEQARSMATPEFAGYRFGKSKGGTLLTASIDINDGTRCSPSYVQWTLGIAGVVAAPRCYWDNRRLERNALNFETEPMLEDYYINGPLQADLWVSSTAQDAVISVRIDEVTPKGRVNPITNGLLLASARAVDESKSRFIAGEMVQPYHYLTQTKEQLLTPGEVVKLQVEIFPTSALIREGNKLRVSISPSNQAQGILNLPRRELAKEGITTIHNSPEYPSGIVLLKVPTSELN
ncbi:CocE/NonD family hydrolase [Ketobacter sp. MCCC 1A13808]|uniref:CocE/NonD family hydrolase n=1 Tax=Ketobacter sp. MCCC 1A13808 TaxID=2602738 RepID=UPI000F1B22E6|nr:CocE/NonD family hydrolase [Ketobacter sp. MCCC 1A13808]MVF13590.1 CocE/NonD family hydrolase [Ketobacter sp. MCCC 1A13808]RLP55844.1 MAG: CocE/NonD family hydrolase [Ketobacter sp.]